MGVAHSITNLLPATYQTQLPCRRAQVPATLASPRITGYRRRAQPIGRPSGLSDTRAFPGPLVLLWRRRVDLPLLPLAAPARAPAEARRDRPADKLAPPNKASPGAFRQTLCFAEALHPPFKCRHPLIDAHVAIVPLACGIAKAG